MNFPEEQWCSGYAEDKDHGAVQADLPDYRKGYEELQLPLPNDIFQGCEKRTKMQVF